MYLLGMCEYKNFRIKFFIQKPETLIGIRYLNRDNIFLTAPKFLSLEIFPYVPYN